LVSSLRLAKFKPKRFMTFFLPILEKWPTFLEILQFLNHPVVSNNSMNKTFKSYQIMLDFHLTNAKKLDSYVANAKDIFMSNCVMKLKIKAVSY